MSGWRQGFRSSDRHPYGKCDRTRGANHEGGREQHTGERLPDFQPFRDPRSPPYPPPPLLLVQPQFTKPHPGPSFWNKARGFLRGADSLGHRHNVTNLSPCPSGHEIQGGKRSFEREHRRDISAGQDQNHFLEPDGRRAMKGDKTSELQTLSLSNLSKVPDSSRQGQLQYTSDNESDKQVTRAYCSSGQRRVETSSRTFDMCEGTGIAGVRNPPFTDKQLTIGAFTDTQLTNALLTNEQLTNGSFTDMQLTNAVLTNEQLTNSSFTDTQLTNALLTNEQLTNSSFTDTQLTNAVFTNEQLTNGRFTDIQLTNTVLADNPLTKGGFTDTQLANTDKQLTNVDFTDLHLVNTALTDKRLTNAVLTDAHLTNAILEDRDLTKASLTNTHLTNIGTEGASELKCASVTDIQVTAASAQVTKLTIGDASACGVSGPEQTSSKKRKKRKRGPTCEQLDEGQSAAVKSYWRKHHAQLMQKDITKRFPDLLRQTYFIPQDLFYKLRYRKQAECGHLPSEILVLDKSELSDLSCDRSEVIVRLSLLYIAEYLQDPMVSLFAYDFEGYLNKTLVQNSLRQLSYEEAFDAARKSRILSSEASGDSATDAVRSSVSGSRLLSKCPFKKARELFPSPEDCQDPQGQENISGIAKQSNSRSKFARGDFDVLIVSRKYGVVVMEIKSIGDHAVIPDKADQMTDASDSDIRKKIEKAVKGHGQLRKSESVLHHLFSDLPEKVTVGKVLAIPYMKRNRLKTAVAADPDLLKQFCSCLGGSPGASLETALDHCLCEEDVGSLDDLCERTTAQSTRVCVRNSRLVSWWQNLTKRPTSSGAAAEDSTHFSSDAMSNDCFVQIVSRFCGMYSTLAVDNRRGHRDEVRTVDECIHLTGVRFGRNMLFPAQKLILDRDDRFLCLTGTPGSGKTLILGLKAVEWLRAGHTVIIVCIKGIEYGTLVSLTLERQVRSWTGSLPTSLRIERLSINTDVKSFVEKLIREHEGKVLKFIIDEIPRQVTRDSQHEKLVSCVESLTKALCQIQKSLLSSPGLSADRPLDFQAVSPDHSSVIRVTPSNILKQIEKVLSFSEARLKCFKVGDTGDFLPVLDEDWKLSLKEIEKLRTQIVSSKKILTERLPDMDTLQEIYTNLHSALGALFNLYSSLYFLVIHTLMKVLVEKQEEENVDISVWTACMFPFDVPRAYQKAKLDLCVRCPPSVQAVLELLDRDVNTKTASPFTYWNLLGVHNPPLPSTGQKIKLLDHSDHVTQVTEVSDCVECGQALLTYLHETLSVGNNGPLRPHDVIICGGPVHANKDCAFLQKLRQKFHIRLECSELDPPPPYEDQVFVIAGSVLQGLEAKIIVYIPEIKYILARKGEELEDRDPRVDLPDWLQHLGTWNRRQLWFVASRSVSHLIVFVCTRPRI